MHWSLTGGEAGLAAYYRFDEGSGSTVADLTGKGNTGTFTALATWVTSTAPVGGIVPPVALSPLDGELAPRAEVAFAWASSSGPTVLDTVTYELHIIAGGVDTSFIVADTTLLIDCDALDLPHAQIPVDWFVAASAGTLGVTSDTSRFVLDTPFHLGDVSDNGEISAQDASLVLKAAVGLDALREKIARQADVTGNGAVTAYDAHHILAHVVGSMPCFPADSLCGGEARPARSNASLALIDQSTISLFGDVSAVGAVEIELRVPSDGRDAAFTALVPDDWMVVHSWSGGVVRIALAGVGKLAAGPLVRLSTEAAGGSYRIDESAVRSLQLSGSPLPLTLVSIAPNPFNPSTTMRFSVRRAGRVAVGIWTVAGQQVWETAVGDLDAGEHQILWDGRDRNGRPVSSGIYLCRVSWEDASGGLGRETVTRRMTLLR